MPSCAPSAPRASGSTPSRGAKTGASTGAHPIPLDLSDTATLYERLGALEADVVADNAGTGRSFDGFFKAAPADAILTRLENQAPKKRQAQSRHEVAHQTT